MKIDRISHCLQVFLFSSICFFANEACAQTSIPDTLSGTIGVMDFKFNAPSGWKIKDSPELNSRVSDMLLDEGIRFKQDFVFANIKTGAMLFGYWNAFPKGLAFEASQTIERQPTFPNSWGIEPGQVAAAVRTSNRGLEYALVRAVGLGDGKTFVGPNKSIKTLAIWANIPVQYESAQKVGSGIIMLQYRGPDFQDGKFSKTVVDNQKMPGDILIKDLIDSLKLDSSVTPLTAEAYRAKYPKEVNGLSKDNADSAAPSVAPQPTTSDISKNGRVDVYSKFPTELTQMINRTRPSSLPSSGPLSVKETMLQKCQELIDIKTDSNLLELANVIQDNYLRSRNCSERLAQWIDWYKSTKPKD